MAWNCAALDECTLNRLCSILRTCSSAIDGGTSTMAKFYSLVKNVTQASTSQEQAILDAIGKDDLLSCSSEAESGHVQHSRDYRESMHDGAKRKKAKANAVIGVSIDTRDVNQYVDVGTPQSRKRISRCGTCSGCLSEDCLVCGHCKDMKKYGGPGLRKQSCKNRKCLNPKSWGPVRKRKVGLIPDGFESAGSDMDSSDEDEQQDFERADVLSTDWADDIRNATTDSEADSVSSVRLPRTVVRQVSADHSYPRALDVHAVVEDSDGYDALSGSEGRDERCKGARSRVMRCGKCAGCTASDCLRCRHCLDMKKYGGPGLRKQSCQARKCVRPKIVVLNQGREDLREDENVLKHDDVAPLSTETVEDSHDDESSSARGAFLLLIQECELVIREFLPFRCAACHVVFATRGHQEHHESIWHNQNRISLKWEQDADIFLQHPGQQLGLVLESLRHARGASASPCVRAYA
ncbi:hypothetical protein PINS_up017124, partial [Pythium insidiosum]